MLTFRSERSAMVLAKRFLCASVLMASPAAAADLSIEANAPAPIEAHSVWTGLYVGGFLGAAFADGKAERDSYGGALISLDVSNGLFPSSIDDEDESLEGGVTVGYNRQFGSLVAGIEADISFTDLEAVAGLNRRDPNPDPAFFNVQTITGYRTSLDAISTVRGRLGFALDRTLLYVTGGLAIGDVENSFTLTIPELGYVSPGWSEGGTRYGYVVGGGVEHKLTEALSIKAEAMYFDLEDTTVFGSDATNFPGQSIAYNFRNDGAVARIGLNFAF